MSRFISIPVPSVDDGSTTLFDQRIEEFRAQRRLRSLSSVAEEHGPTERCRGGNPDKAEEDQTIASAAEILKRRMLRLGSLTDPTAATDFLKVRLSALDHEVFFVIYLDTQHAILAAEVASTGTIDGAEVHPREIVKRALQHNAAAIICAHNHPSNNVEPSAADRAVTSRLKQALALVDIRLLDHFVVSGNSYTSLAERGWV